MEIKYIELRTGYPNQDGPAWIGKVKMSKSGKTIYFNDHAFQKYHGVCANYIDIDRVWQTAVEDIKPLREYCEKVLKEN